VELDALKLGQAHPLKHAGMESPLIVREQLGLLVFSSIFGGNQFLRHLNDDVRLHSFLR
jgi:hypothetical protein